VTTDRVRPGTLREVGPTAWILARGGGALARSEPLNLFLVLGRHRRLFRGWLHFARRLMPFGLLPRVESELVILRVAHLRGSSYEFTQHDRIGRRAGLTSADIERVRFGPDADGWSPRRQAILTAVDELVERRDIGDGTWRQLRGFLDEREALELVLLAGHYDMLAACISALRIQPERPRRRA
jgi:alkylhydroperoxidase family enzyme